jgi:hypothetical protein
VSLKSGKKGDGSIIYGRSMSRNSQRFPELSYTEGKASAIPIWLTNFILYNYFLQKLSCPRHFGHHLPQPYCPDHCCRHRRSSRACRPRHFRPLHFPHPSHLQSHGSLNNTFPLSHGLHPIRTSPTPPGQWRAQDHPPAPLQNGASRLWRRFPPFLRRITLAVPCIIQFI